MLTGQDALFSIEKAISGARADERRLDLALQSATADATRLMQQEAEGFRALARVKLDAMARNQVIGDLDATERRALAMIEDHRQSLDLLSSQRDATQTALERAEADKRGRDQQLSQALKTLDDKRHGVSEMIKTNAVWQAARSAVADAEAIAANADKKAAMAEADLAEKGKPYESDPLFMYLWTKKHDQSEDKSGSFVRFFDRKVARLIGYSDARANYAMLREIPLRLREHASAKQGDVDAARRRVVDIERQALIADGIEPLEKDAAGAQAAADAAAQAVMKATSELQQIESQRQQATGAGEKAVYDQAVDLLTKALEQDDFRRLHDDAMRTATQADDQAIAAIADARQALQKANDEVAQIRAQIREMADRRGELEGARDRARRQGYDNPGGSFSDQIDLGSVIGGILRGAVRGGALDDIFRDGYRAPRPRSDPNFGGRRNAPSWPSPWSGGDSGSFGGSGGNDNQSSGGWRTGGSF